MRGGRGVCSGECVCHEHGHKPLYVWVCVSVSVQTRHGVLFSFALFFSDFDGQQPPQTRSTTWAAVPPRLKTVWCHILQTVKRQSPSPPSARGERDDLIAVLGLGVTDYANDTGMGNVVPRRAFDQQKVSLPSAAGCVE